MEVIGSKTESTVVLFDEKNKKYVIVDTTTDQEITINEELLISLGKIAQRKKTERSIIKPYTSSITTSTAASSSSYSTSSVLPSSLEQAVDDFLKDVSLFNDDGSVKETFIEVDRFNKEFKTDLTIYIQIL